MLRYVVLHHIGYGEPHYDLMVEDAPGGLLRTWRLDRWPAAEDVKVTSLPVHRRAYLTYEGPVSGNRGEVRRVAEGVLSSDARLETAKDILALINRHRHEAQP
jgi:hypothetical protein